MSSGKEGKEVMDIIAEQAKVVAVEVYKDAAKPAVSAAGSTLGRLVRLALSPIDLLAQGGERLMSAVERKLNGVPENRLLPPPATIAAPAALHYALLGDGEDTSQLREMFENLLVSSMDTNTADTAHPAFVSIISQLTHDEAWILKSIDRDAYPYMELNGRRRIISLLGMNIGIRESLLSVYISNLSRLGLIAFHDGVAGLYENASPEFMALAEREFPDEQSRIMQLRGESLLTMQITALGKQFIASCVRNQ
jgi:hypothetical protein